MKPEPEPPPKRSDAEIFADAVRGAAPLPGSAHVPPAPPAPLRTPFGRAAEDAEALATLNDVVSGIAVFDVHDTEENVEGMVAGLDRRILHKLRAGEYAFQAHLDLHGLTVEGARTEVRQFVFRAVRAGYRCVLVVHGRGRNSPDQRPVLKDALKGWLTRGDLARLVLAFATARPCDGGAGATYVLLRRQRRGKKKPFWILDGSRS